MYFVKVRLYCFEYGTFITFTAQCVCSAFIGKIAFLKIVKKANLNANFLNINTLSFCEQPLTYPEFVKIQLAPIFSLR